MPDIYVELPNNLDLFYSQPLVLDDTGMLNGTLHGPDFKLIFTSQPFTLDGQKVALSGKLVCLGSLALSPSMDVDVELQKNAEKRYQLLDHEALRVRVPQQPVSGSLELKESAAKVAVGLQPWRLVLGGAGAPAAASLAIPGLDGIRFAIHDLTLNAAGVVACRAALEPGEASIGGLLLRISDGTLTMRGTRIEARLRSSFALACFAGSSVELELAVSGDLANPQWIIEGHTRIASNAPWHDPSGLLSFDRMALSVDFTPAAAGGYTTTVRVGGRVTFLRQLLPDGVDAWFGGLFSGLAVDFEKTALTMDAAGLQALKFKPLDGLRLRALGIFDMRVHELTIDQRSVTLGEVTLRFDEGGATVSGAVGHIKIGLGARPSLDLDGSALTVEVGFAAPGGLKAQGRLAYVKDANSEALAGQSQMSSPMLTPVEAKFRIGRFKPAGGDEWLPTVAIMVAREDVNIPLFPGVVITRIELCAGVNRTIPGVTGLTLAGAQQVLERGLPDVFDQNSWHDDKVALSLAARIYTEPSETLGDRLPSFYVADMALLLTTELQLAVFGKLWFYTSRADARSAPFQRYPSAVGLAMLDGQQPSLRMVARTHADGKSTLLADIPAGRLLCMQLPESRMAFEATPAGMALVLGPAEVGTDLGPLRVAGSTLFALRSAGGRVYALSHSTLNASFSAATRPLQLGPASFSASLNAGFAARLTLLGNFERGKLTVYGAAHASFCVDLALHVRIGFSIRISYGFGSTTISWHKDWDFGLRVHIDLDLEVALTSDAEIGIDGRARIEVNVLGIGASLALAVQAGSVSEARALYGRIAEDVNQLLGAPA